MHMQSPFDFPPADEPPTEPPAVENDEQVIEIRLPPVQTLALVLSSPHSGRDYPADFVAGSQLSPHLLRGSEDCFVDELFADGPSLGAPLLRALFPRAYVDPNREPYELDPAMFSERLPSYVNTASPRVAAGLGTVPRVVASGAVIQRDKLDFADAAARIECCYKPYHAALARLLRETHRRFGHCLLLDCHSMPSVGGPTDKDPGRNRVDFVIGDRHGASCARPVADAVEATLRDLGYTVRRNLPYAGGFVTRHYGRPNERCHALQIEINRALYMDEARLQRTDYFATLASHMRQLVAVLGGIGADALDAAA